MADFSFVLLYVENPIKSATFYSTLIGRPIIEQSPTFAMLPLRDGVMLGLWIRSGVEPRAIAPAGASEIAFTEESYEAVTVTFADWKRRGITMAQEPTKMDFGFTFTALDPDGHRLRVFSPAG